MLSPRAQRYRLRQAPTRAAVVSQSARTLARCVEPHYDALARLPHQREARRLEELDMSHVVRAVGLVRISRERARATGEGVLDRSCEERPRDPLPLGVLVDREADERPDGASAARLPRPVLG